MGLNLYIRSLIFLSLILFFPVYTFSQNWAQILKVAASDRTEPTSMYRSPGEAYGFAVAIDGDYAVIGAPKEDSSASLANSAIDAGAAYVLKKQLNGQWKLVRKLVPSDRATLDEFGSSVAISGNIIVVGAYLEDENTSNTGTLSAAGSAYIFSKDQGGTDNWGQVKKLIASDRAIDDQFGFSVAINGNLVVVGAPQEDHDAVGGNELLSAGAAYVFSKDQGSANNWGQVKKLVASNRSAGNRFGRSVAILNSDIVIGGESAYIFKKDQGGTSNWGQFAILTPSGGEIGFGNAVAIASNTIVIGSASAGTGAAYVYGKDQGGTDNWGLVKKLEASDKTIGDNFGSAVSISSNYIVVSAHMEDDDANGTNSLSNAGSAYMFSKDQGGSNNWGQIKKIVSSDRAEEDYFGWTAVLNGTTVFVAAVQEDENENGLATMSLAGSAYSFSKDQGGTDNWGQTQKLVSTELPVNAQFGYSVSIDGDYAVVGTKLELRGISSTESPMINAGAAYVYKKINGVWTELKKLVASDRTAGDLFGHAVTISGSTIVVSALGETHDVSGLNYKLNAGSAYIFQKDQGGTDNWGQLKKIVPIDRTDGDNFGNAVSISGDLLVVAAYNDDNPDYNSGSVYIFQKDQNGVNNWGEVKKIAPTDKAYGDNFGGSVSINGTTLLVGASNEDDDAAGLNPILSAGSAYIFEKDQGGLNNWGQVKKIVASERSGSNYYGFSVALSGTTAAVGGYNEGTDANGANLIGGAGSVYIYQKDMGGSSNWGQVRKIVASDRAAGDNFSYSIAINGPTLVVGAYNEDHDVIGSAYMNYAGSAYIFEKDQGGTNNWGQVQKIVSNDRLGGDQLGYSVAITNSYMLIGANLEDEDAQGLNNVSASGSAYFFDNFTLLPVVWKSIQATAGKNEVLLKWQTYSEQNSSHFTVQHSTDGRNWKSLSSIPASGNSITINDYQFRHQFPTNGQNMYRIMQTDLDGKFSYSEVRSLLFKHGMTFRHFPNPVSHTLTIELSEQPNELNIRLSDINGKQVSSHSYQRPDKIVSINVETLKNGNYILEIKADGKTYSDKIVKQ